MNYSHYQTDIFDWVKRGGGHGQGRALAGSGKTVTMVRSLEDMRGSVLAVAFNKSIADELSRRVPKHVQASTTHSFGLRMLHGRPRIDKDKVSRGLESLYDMTNKADKAEFWKLRSSVTKLVSLMKAEGFYEKPTGEQVQELAEFYGIETPPKAVAMAMVCLEESKRDERTIDFDDMIFMPIYLGLKPKKFDWVAVDEYQDMNRSQSDLLNLATGAADPFELTANDGRMFVVGDPHQAIYGFRGALNGIMDQFVKEKSAKMLPLNICYRCSRAVIREAQKYVPEIEACEGAPEGIVGQVRRDTFEKDVSAGDYALCRKVAPLVSACLRLIRLGRRATVRGREIGEQLASALDNLPNGEDLGERLEKYRASQLEKLSRAKYGAEDRIDALHDRVDTLIVLMESTDNGTIGEVKEKIRSLFSNELDDRSVILSSIHKAKGLEADRVYILPSTPVKTTQSWQDEQEKNLSYVATTRARKELYYVQ